MVDPMYRQIAEDLRHQIEAGELAPGVQLRTELELREKYNASRNTVRDAIKLLITRGLVETRPGQGTYVVQTISPFVTTLTGDAASGGNDEGPVYASEVQAMRRTPEAPAPRVEIQLAESGTAVALQVPEGSTVISRHQRRLIDQTPWSLQTSFYPMEFIERGATRLLQADDIKEGTVAYLARTLQIKQAGWRDTIIVRAPDVEETRFFKLPDDGRISVVETRRTAYDDQGLPIRLTVSVYPADRNQFAVNVGDLPSQVADPPSADQSSSLPAEPDQGT
jgi:GntR family transcriptional regulator